MIVHKLTSYTVFFYTATFFFLQDMKNQLKVDFTVGTSSFLGCVKNTLTLENTKIQGTSESKAIQTYVSKQLLLQ